MTDSPAHVRLLVVEDDVMQSEMVERALGRDGFEVRIARSIGELRTVVGDFVPELVLVDVNMPDAPDGQMVGLVRDLVPTARVVLYSAWEEPKLRKLARELGAHGFISKSESVFAIAGRLRELSR
jgi:two-component system, OmpR family, response regulator